MTSNLNNERYSVISWFFPLSLQKIGRLLCFYFYVLSFSLFPLFSGGRGSFRHESPQVIKLSNVLGLVHPPQSGPLQTWLFTICKLSFKVFLSFSCRIGSFLLLTRPSSLVLPCLNLYMASYASRVNFPQYIISRSAIWLCRIVIML